MTALAMVAALALGQATVTTPPGLTLDPVGRLVLTHNLLFDDGSVMAAPGIAANIRYPDGGGYNIAIQFGQGCGSDGMEFPDVAQLDGGGVQTPACYNQNAPPGDPGLPGGVFDFIVPVYVGSLGGGGALIMRGGLLSGYDTAVSIPKWSLTQDSPAGGDLQAPGLNIQMNNGINKIRLQAISGYSHRFSLGENFRDVSSSFFHDSDSTANDGVGIVYDANNGAPDTECLTEFYLPAGVGDQTSNAKAVRKTCVNGTTTALGALVPGAGTLLTCTKSTNDNTHVPEGAIQLKAGLGNCECRDIGASVMKWCTPKTASGSCSGTTTTCTN